ncbi:MAG: glycosyltransferase family 2 protein [Myxococcota bacterium]
MKPCLLIPIYNHGATIAEVVSALSPLGLPCLIVDDGSDDDTRAALIELEAAHSWVRVERRSPNAGRGVALRVGYRLAAQLGHSHVVQIDADGQHDARDVPVLLEAARQRPGALVLGAPLFDDSAPAGRRYGRWLSRVWVWVETCSLEIRDPLCGLRCLPLEPTLRILDAVACGDRMDFDPEIAVRLVWAGVPVVNVPTRVRYFDGGISHFDLVRDNLRISWLHTRLFFGMLPRSGRLLARQLWESA